MKGYYSAVFAIVGMLCLGLAGIVTMSPQPVNQLNASNTPTYNTSQKLNSSENGIRTIKQSAQNLPNTLYDETYYDREDLKAQNSMADWTTYMGIAAFFGVFLSSIGVYLIWKTFHQTQKAAESAKGTVDAYIAVERARLNISISNIWDIDERPKCKFVTTNYGKTDCIVVSVAHDWRSNKEFEPGAVMLGSPQSIIVKSGETEDVAISRQPGVQSRFLVGHVKYKSALSDDHITFFCFEVWFEGSRQQNDFGENQGHWKARSVDLIGWPENR